MKNIAVGDMITSIQYPDDVDEEYVDKEYTIGKSYTVTEVENLKWATYVKVDNLEYYYNLDCFEPFHIKRDKLIDEILDDV